MTLDSALKLNLAIQLCKAESGTGVPHLQENAPPLGLYRTPMPRVLGVSLGGGRFLMGEVPLYAYPRSTP